MKIYFAGSIRGGREDANIYNQIILLLKNYGEVLTEHIGNVSLESSGEQKITDVFIHDRDLSWIVESDLMIAEVSNPSLGVGYEIAKAVELNKNIYCLYRISSKNKLSAMISGSNDIKIIKYDSLDTLKTLLSNFLTK